MDDCELTKKTLLNEIDYQGRMIDDLVKTMKEIARYESWEWKKIKNTDKFCVLFTSLAREALDKVKGVKQNRKAK